MYDQAPTALNRFLSRFDRRTFAPNVYQIITGVCAAIIKLSALCLTDVTHSAVMRSTALAIPPLFTMSPSD